MELLQELGTDNVVHDKRKVFHPVLLRDEASEGWTIFCA
jgi:hypothetical protein